ncbi:MAG: preprotein translocase subunit SecY [archaeon]
MSFVHRLKPLYSVLPEVKPPEKQQTVKKRLIWSAIALVIFFVMGNIQIIGLSASSTGQLEQLQLILASNIGTLITAGIGPIVLASIVLQLLVGSKIINLDLSNPTDKAAFAGTQKLLAIILSFFEAVVYVMSGLLAPMPGMFIIVVAQVAIGSILILYLDEVVSKWGFGSGIGLFIAGGVSGAIFWRLFAPPIASTQGFTQGIISTFIAGLAGGFNITLLLLFLPVIFTLIIFFIVVYAEGIHVNIPITLGQQGMGGRFPVKFLYVSNLPVILAVALFANFQMWATIGANSFLGGFLGLLATYTSAPYIGGQSLIEALLLQGLTGPVLGGIMHGIVYGIIFITVCIVFGKFWVEMAGQGPENVADQLQGSGMYIPGFRRDKRIIVQVLKRYIPPITILGSAFVGFLAVMADFTGALGTGTGILLTVGIVYRLYEELAKQQFMETNPLLKRVFG